jgi:predicted adenylyl cyclase CyaB
MLEVEAKIPISKTEYENLKKRLSKEGGPIKELVNTDTYYEKPHTAFIRVRQNQDKNVFGIKRRETIDGIESNIEVEWGIKELGKWRALLSRLKIRPYIRKFKRSTIFRLDGFGIELNYVRHLGYYLEIERLVRSADEAVKVKNELIELFGKLGYSPKQFEPKPYLQLLENV